MYLPAMLSKKKLFQVFLRLKSSLKLTLCLGLEFCINCVSGLIMLFNRGQLFSSLNHM